MQGAYPLGIGSFFGSYEMGSRVLYHDDLCKGTIYGKAKDASNIIVSYNAYRFLNIFRF